MKVVQPDGVQAFSVTLDNSTGTQAATYRVFDAAGVVDAIQGATGVNDPDSATITYSALVETIKSFPIVIKSFNYEVTTNAQFSNPFKVLRGTIQGDIDAQSTIISAAQRNTQFQDNLLTVQKRMIIDAQTAIDLDVKASELVTLTFMVEGFLAH